MIDSNHTAMLEHGTLYLKFVHDYDNEYGWDANDVDGVSFTLHLNDYVHTNIDFDNHISYHTVNYRTLIQLFGDRPELLQWVISHAVPYDEHFQRRVTVKFTCNRQVSHEFVRHRVFSFAQESTRYCNYSKSKFGNELTFIKPLWGITRSLVGCLNEIEVTYFDLINNEGWKPQQAATILPNALKTELVMTGTVQQWEEFFKLRALGTTGAPHPQAKQLAEPLYEEFIRRGYIDRIVLPS